MAALQDIADPVIGLAGSAQDGAASPAASLKTILVVDDELGPREALRHILTPVYNVVMAKDGREAMELFAVARPDMVISDIRMPVMSGIELMKNLRRRSGKARSTTSASPTMFTTSGRRSPAPSKMRNRRAKAAGT